MEYNKVTYLTKKFKYVFALVTTLFLFSKPQIFYVTVPKIPKSCVSHMSKAKKLIPSCKITPNTKIIEVVASRRHLYIIGGPNGTSTTFVAWRLCCMYSMSVTTQVINHMTQLRHNSRFLCHSTTADTLTTWHGRWPVPQKAHPNLPHGSEL